MSITLSEHAKDQIKRRKIPFALVKEVVDNPEKIVKSFRGRELRKALVNDKILEVVIKSEDSNIIVITAYYLKEEHI